MTGDAPDTRFALMLEQARKQGRAIGAFTCYTLEGFEALVEASARQRAPAIALVGAGSFRRRGGRRFTRALCAMANDAPTEILVQVDHLSSLDDISSAVSCGVHAIMADGSRLPFEDNVAFTRAASDVVRPHGVGLEAELGRLEGHEDRAVYAAHGEMTDPRQAAELAERTGVDCLAVAIGNVHGPYQRIPTLSWDRLDAVLARVAVPISLHGASGLPDPQVRRVVRAGSSKLNINTDLRAAHFARLSRDLELRAQHLDLQGLCDDLIEAVAGAIEKKLKLLGWSSSEGVRGEADDT